MAEINFHKHIEYKALIDSWIMYRDLFTGHHETLVSPSYLWQHEFEKSSAEGASDLYEVRRNRTRYVNLIKPIVKRYTSLLFTNEIDFSDIDKAIPEEERADIDGAGTSLEAFIKEHIAKNYFIYGKPAVLVDSFGIATSSLGEEREVGQRPFMETLHPLEIIDWDIETGDPARKGKINFLRVEYEILEPRTSPQDEPQVFRYTKIFYVDGGRYHQALYKGDKIDTGSAGQKANGWTLIYDQAIGDSLAEVPIALTQKESWLSDLCPIALLRHNTQSSLDNQLLFQAHQRIIGTGDFSDGDAVANEATWLLVKGEGSVQVIEPSQPVSLEKRLETLTLDLFRVAFCQTRPMPADSKVAIAADSQREAKDEFIATLQAGGKEIEDLVNQAVKNYAAFKGIKDFEGKVKFDFDITLDDVDQQIAIASAFAADISRHPKWKKELLKKIATYQGLNSQDMILDEIENTELQAPEARTREQIFQGFQEAAGEDLETEQGEDDEETEEAPA